MSARAKPEQLPFDLGHRHAHGREDFWVSGSNASAVAWLDKWPDWPAPALILFGPPASGKTHLLQVWRREAGASEIPAQRLGQDSADTLAGPHKALIIDDAAQALTSRAAQECLLHLYNMMRERNGHILLAAGQPVKEWGLSLPDLQSRLLAAPAAAISSPDDQLRAVVLTKLFSDRQIFVPQDVVEFILPRVDRSFAALRALVEKIDRKALSEKRAVTIPLAREILQS